MIPKNILQAYDEYKINYYMNIQDETIATNEKDIDKIRNILIEKEVKNDE